MASAAPPNFGSEVVLLPFTGALWGATCVQTFLYFVHHSRGDILLHKILVIWLWLADTVHLILTLLGVYQLTIVHYGDFAFISTISQNFLWSLFFTTVVSCPVQLYFTYRIWIISGRKAIFPVVFVPLAIAQPAIYTAFLVICYGNITTNRTLYAVTDLLIAVWSTSAAIDILIAASLLYYVRKLKTAISGFQSTGKILDRAAVLTVNTGAWTALCSLFTIITISAFPTSPAFTAVAFLICPLYCNTLLANLNSRGYIRGGDFNDPVGYRYRTSFDGSFGFARGSGATRSTQTPRPDAIGISLGAMDSSQHTNNSVTEVLKDKLEGNRDNRAILPA